jgi:hypothetical protein
MRVAPSGTVISRVTCDQMAGRVLFVILGAGASYAASSIYEAAADRRPPLTKELFDSRFAEILNRYPMAKNAAPEILDAIAGSEHEPAVSLEEHLRVRYRDSTDDLDRRRFLSIPLYLQEVLWQVSQPYNVALDLDHLIRLVNRLLREFSHVSFVTLNYDALLDRILNDIHPLAALQHFTSYPRWSLIKLHGSITWGYRLLDVGGIDLNNPPAELDAQIDRSEIFHSMNLRRDVLRVKTDRDGNRLNAYPALSAPLGPDDEIVCPKEHEEFLRTRLDEVGAVDLLVVGYSALDQTALRLLAESSKEVRTLYVVNMGREPAVEVAKRMANHFSLSVNSRNVAVADDPFEVWVRSGLPAHAEWVSAGGRG